MAPTADVCRTAAACNNVSKLLLESELESDVENVDADTGSNMGDMYKEEEEEEEDSSCCCSNCFDFPEMLNSEGQAMCIGQALVDVLKDAVSEGRVTQGFYECGKLLQANPTNVMVCVMAENCDMSRDVAYKIHTTLLEAFCLENDIWLIKVDSSRKLCQLLMSSHAEDDDAVGHVTTFENSPCLLVEFAADEGVTLAEEDLLSYCRMTSDISPQPIIELPS